ncbi:unnamed protein product [Ambrosiozyma monospora]|uniref:Unnamed protein product n=1 Tax=Ambrosiozyma monospora TaxID=43982 RepID=A0ACB5U497_AMBMO|nr:unnamed protein product [Ambrosiozyma monospora]
MIECSLWLSHLSLCKPIGSFTASLPDDKVACSRTMLLNPSGRWEKKSALTSQLCNSKNFKELRFSNKILLSGVHSTSFITSSIIEKFEKFIFGIVSDPRFTEEEGEMFSLRKVGI